MRLFVELEDGRTITLWVSDNTRVAESKKYIEASGRTKLTASKMRLLCDVAVMGDEKLVSDFASPTTPNQCQAILQEIIPGGSLDYIHFFSPFPGTQARSTDVTIKVVLSEGVSLPDLDDLALALRVYGPRNQRVAGDLSFVKATRTLSFTASYLMSNSNYSVYLHGSFFSLSPNGSTPLSQQSTFANFEWAFKTPKLTQVRLLTTCMNAKCFSQPAPPPTALVIIGRQSMSLFQELLHEVAKRFSIHPSQIGGLHATSIGHCEIDVTDDTDVVRLNDSFTLSFHVRPFVPVPADNNVWTAAQLERYLEDNWVNDASGYLALCGKMSPEEEEEALLAIVNAFADAEDNKDGIAANSLRRQEDSQCGEEESRQIDFAREGGLGDDDDDKRSQEAHAGMHSHTDILERGENASIEGGAGAPFNIPTIGVATVPHEVTSATNIADPRDPSRQHLEILRAVSDSCMNWFW